MPCYLPVSTARKCGFEELTSDTVVVELVAVGSEVLTHARYICIRDVLFTEELTKSVLEDSYVKVAPRTRQKTGLFSEAPDTCRNTHNSDIHILI